MLALAGPGEVKALTDEFPCQIRVEILTESPPWPRNAKTDRLFEFWREAGEELAYPTNIEERGGLSDGNQLWNAVPTLDGLGPWGDNDHFSERSADGAKLPEFIEASSLVPKAALNTRAILRLLAAEGGG